MLKFPSKFFFVVTALACAMSIASARPPTLASDDAQLTGTVIDQTFTVAGHEFCRLFAALWREQSMAERYALSVHELPSARSGTLIYIALRDQRVFESRLPSRRADLANLAQEAVERGARNLVDGEVQRLMVQDRDLAPVEM